MKQWYLVSYDVRDEKRLRRVARLLEGYGVRMQYSVFRCYLAHREVERLRWELAQRMEGEDNLLIAGLCAQCVNRIRQRGGVHSHEEDWPAEPEGHVII